MRIAFLLAWRSLTSRPGRSLTSILGIAVGIATVLAVQVIDHNTILTQAATMPGLLHDISFTIKDNVVALFASGYQYQYRFRFIKARQIVKVTILTKWKFSVS